MRPIAFATALLVLLLAPSTAEASSWRWPVAGAVISPYANGPDPYAGGQHRGIDIAAPAGTPVVTAAAGAVTFAGVAGSSGRTVAVRTDDGFDTSYLHLASVSVRPGDRVAAGGSIGRVGTTGRRSAADPHLHFGVREAGSRFAYRDPLDFLPAAPPATTPPAAVPVPEAVPVRPRPDPLPALAAALALPVPAPAVAAAATTAPATTAPADPHTSRPHPASPRAATPAASQSAAPLAQGPPHRTPAHPRPTSAHAPLATPERVTPRHPHRAAPDPRRPRSTATAARPAAGPGHVDRFRSPSLALVPAARRTSPRRGAGLDLGWLAACIAMVVAATILGRPRASTRSVRRAFEIPLADPDRP